jgi:hypothetical protein
MVSPHARSRSSASSAELAEAILAAFLPLLLPTIVLMGAAAASEVLLEEEHTLLLRLSGSSSSDSSNFRFLLAFLLEAIFDMEAAIGGCFLFVVIEAELLSSVPESSESDSDSTNSELLGLLGVLRCFLGGSWSVDEDCSSFVLLISERNGYLKRM